MTALDSLETELTFVQTDLKLPVHASMPDQQLLLTKVEQFNDCVNVTKKWFQVRLDQHSIDKMTAESKAESAAAYRSRDRERIEALTVMRTSAENSIRELRESIVRCNPQNEGFNEQFCQEAGGQNFVSIPLSEWTNQVSLFSFFLLTFVFVSFFSKLTRQTPFGLVLLSSSSSLLPRHHPTKRHQ